MRSGCPTRYRIAKPKKNNWGDYEVVVYEDGIRDEDKTYYTDDKGDAWATYNEMVKEIERRKARCRRS